MKTGRGLAFALLVIGVVATLVLASPKEMMTMQERASFAAGCFWGVEKIFGKLPGIISTRVGYAGGHTPNPTYEQVCTGHAEAVEIVFDSSRVSYDTLLLTFWQYHDPTTQDRQGPDIGSQYRSIIFYHTEEQHRAAEQSIALLNQSGIYRQPIVTEVVQAGDFWEAEEYHQKYLQKNPSGYCSHVVQSERIAQVLSPAAAPERRKG